MRGGTQVLDAETRLLKLLEEADSAHARVEAAAAARDACAAWKPKPIAVQGDSIYADLQQRRAHILLDAYEPSYAAVASASQSGTSSLSTPAGLVNRQPPPITAQFATTQLVATRNAARGVRENRRTARLQRDLADTSSTIRELDRECDHLRRVCERQRTELSTCAQLRDALDASNARVTNLEEEAHDHRRIVDDLRFELREAEAERERLRTLLAGTIWFQHDQRDIAKSASTRDAHESKRQPRGAG